MNVIADRIAVGTTVRVVSGLVKGLEGKFITQNRGNVTLSVTLPDGRCVTATMRGKVRLVSGA